MRALSDTCFICCLLLAIISLKKLQINPALYSYILLKKSFAPLTLYSMYFQTLRVCNFAKREEKCMKQYSNYVGFNRVNVETDTQTSEFTLTAISLQIPKIHIFPKILQNAIKIYFVH